MAGLPGLILGESTRREAMSQAGSVGLVTSLEPEHSLKALSNLEELDPDIKAKLSKIIGNFLINDRYRSLCLEQIQDVIENGSDFNHQVFEANYELISKTSQEIENTLRGFHKDGNKDAKAKFQPEHIYALVRNIIKNDPNKYSFEINPKAIAWLVNTLSNILSDDFDTMAEGLRTFSKRNIYTEDPTRELGNLLKNESSLTRVSGSLTSNFKNFCMFSNTISDLLLAFRSPKVDLKTIRDTKVKKDDSRRTIEDLCDRINRLTSHHLNDAIGRDISINFHADGLASFKKIIQISDGSEIPLKFEDNGKVYAITQETFERFVSLTLRRIDILLNHDIEAQFHKGKDKVPPQLKLALNRLRTKAQELRPELEKLLC